MKIGLNAFYALLLLITMVTLAKNLRLTNDKKVELKGGFLST